MIKMIILDALEIKMHQDAEIERQSDIDSLSWEVLSFDKDFLKLQIYFLNPNEIGIFQADDYLTITFFGLQFFKNSQGIEV